MLCLFRISHELVGLVLVVEHRLQRHVEDPLRDVELDLVLVLHLPTKRLLLPVGLHRGRLRQRRALLRQTLLLLAAGVEAGGACWEK